jgi:hypothetical protein
MLTLQHLTLPPSPRSSSLPSSPFLSSPPPPARYLAYTFPITREVHEAMVKQLNQRRKSVGRRAQLSETELREV